MGTVDHSGPNDLGGNQRFELKRRLGAGGMGEVWEAWDRERGARVALKILRSLDGDAVLRFKHEFQTFQELHHPNLVRLGELFASGSSWFFTMELVEGVELLDYVRPLDGALARAAHRALASDVGRVPPSDRWKPAVEAPATPPLDEARLRAALAQLTSALQALHAADLVHRDVKPSNILVDRNGRLVLLDFGLATERRERLVTNALSRGEVVGTVDYMAPEQASDTDRVAPAADWYAVGVLLYEALTARVPFQGGAIDVLLQKQHAEPASPRSLVPEVPADLDALCAALLRRDPAARPGAREVLRQLGVTYASQRIRVASPAAREATPFVGRARELDLLAAAYADARHHAVAVLVEGESGVGKTALVRRFVDTHVLAGGSSDAADALVLVGRCHERASVPFKAFDGLVDSLTQWLARLPNDRAAAMLPRRARLLAQVFPVLRRVEAVARAPLDLAERRGDLDPKQQRSRVFLAACELLQRVAEVHRLVLVIDDLQWADADSLALLGEILQPANAPPLLLVATRWSESAQPIAGDDVRRVNVAPLGAGDARLLAEQLIERAPAEARTNVAPESLAADSGGHPMFLAELVRHAAPGRVRLVDALWARIRALDAAAQRVLSLIAVAGGPVPLATAAHAAELGLEELSRVVSPLRAAHLVRSTGARASDTVDLYHHQVRRAVLAHLDAAARKQLHERLALALEAETHPPYESLAQHWREAGDAVRAAGYAARAAAEAATGLAFERAARLYRLALELDAARDEARAWKAQLGDALANAGRGAEAGAAYREAAEGAPPAEAIRLQQRAGGEYLRAGLIDEGVAMFDHVLARLGDHPPSTPRRALLSVALARAKLALRGRTCTPRDAREVAPDVLQRLDAYWAIGVPFSLVDTLRGAEFLTRHLRLALDAGEPSRIAPSLAGDAAFLWVTGASRQRVDALLAEAVSIAERSGDARAIGFVTVTRGMVAYLCGEFRRTVELGLEGERIFRDGCIGGVSWELSSIDVFVCSALYFLGRCRAMVERVERRLRECEELGDRYGATNLRLGHANLAWLMKGDPETARGMAAEGLRSWTQKGFHVQHHFSFIADGQIDLYLGDGAAALARVEAADPKQRASMLHRVPNIRIATHDMRARAALACAHLAAPSERKRFMAMARADVGRLERERLPWVHANAKLFRAALAALAGDEARAQEGLAAAERAYEACGMQLHAAVARWRRGVLVGGDEGRALQAAAQAWMAGEGVREPERMAAIFAPGFGG